jgi:hypothetical protein
LLSLLPSVLQFGAKFGGAFGRVMFAASAEDAAPAAADLSAALAWLEGQASSSGPFILGPELSLVRGAVGKHCVLQTSRLAMQLFNACDRVGRQPLVQLLPYSVTKQPSCATSACSSLSCSA